jgi:hypothetical protein
VLSTKPLNPLTYRCGSASAAEDGAHQLHSPGPDHTVRCSTNIAGPVNAEAGDCENGPWSPRTLTSQIPAMPDEQNNLSGIPRPEIAEEWWERADRRDCARLPSVSWYLPAIGSADGSSLRWRHHWHPRLLGWPTGWDPRVQVGALAEHLIAACAPVVVSDTPQGREVLAAEPAPHCFDADEIGIRWRRTACTQSVCPVQAAPD